MSDLRDALDSYLHVRRALGFKLRDAGRKLSDFVTYLEDRGETTITTVAALAWAQQPADAPPGRWAERLSMTRGFAKYVRSLDPATQIPPTRVWLGHRRRSPFIYSRADIVGLLDAARMLEPPFRAATCATVIGLLAVSGMRVGEAIALDRDDVDWRSGIVTIRSTKFGKSRELALHPTTVAALADYAAARDARPVPSVAPSFFVTLSGSRLYYTFVFESWMRIVERVGLDRCRDGRPVRMHDLRHSFATMTLAGWHDDGGDVEARLPLLSTYLGHVNPASTYWYFSGTPQLLTAAARRLEPEPELAR